MWGRVVICVFFYIDLGQFIVLGRVNSRKVRVPSASVGPEGLGQPAGVRYEKHIPYLKRR